MKIGFFLPGRFHFIPIIDFFLQSKLVSIIILPSKVRIKKLFSTQSLSKVRVVNLVAVEVINRIPNTLGFRYFSKHREILFFLVFDFIAQWFVSKKLDFIIVCSHSALFSLKRAKKKGVTTILEVSSAHVVKQNELVTQGYRNLNFSLNYYTNFLIQRDLLEYEIADRILVPSDFVLKSMLENGIPREKLIKVPYGIDANYWRHDCNNEKASLNQVRIIFCGHISVQKGISELLKAWENVCEKCQGSELALTLCGSIDDNIKDLVFAACERYANIKYLGKVNKETLRCLYAQNDALILPSLQDGYGIVLNEAFACGLKVIGSCRTGITELPVCNRVVNLGEPTEKNIASAIMDLRHFSIPKDNLKIPDWNEYSSLVLNELGNLKKLDY